MAMRGNQGAFDLIDGASSYGRFNSISDYSYDAGVLILPVASEAALTTTVRTHGGMGTRRVSFNAAKQGNPPVVPSAEDFVGNDRLNTARLLVNTATPNPNTGGYNWTISGEYTYTTTESPRIPGQSMFPAVSYPYPNPTQDVIASGTFKSETPEQVALKMRAAGTILQSEWIWPITTFPSNLLGNPILIGV